MKKIDLSDHFVDKTATLKWVPCNSQKDYRNMQKINEEMEIVRSKYQHMSNQSWVKCHRMVLRSGR